MSVNLQLIDVQQTNFLERQVDIKVGFCSYASCSSLSLAWEPPWLLFCLVNPLQSTEGARRYPTSTMWAQNSCLWCPVMLSVLSQNPGHSVVCLCVQDSNNSFKNLNTPKQSILASLLNLHPRPSTSNIYSFSPIVPKVTKASLKHQHSLRWRVFKMSPKGDVDEICWCFSHSGDYFSAVDLWNRNQMRD